MARKRSTASHLSRFFRVLLPGFSKKLVLPRAFVQRLTKEKPYKKATLVNPNGKSWRVDVCRDEQDMHFGGDTWVQFLHAHNIGLGYFLVFCHKGNMIFDFQAYNLSTCEIGYPSLAPKKGKLVEKMEDLNPKIVNRRICFDPKITKTVSRRRACQDIRFESKMTKYNLTKPYMYIPTGIIRECSELAWLKEMILKDPEGRSWSVHLFHRKRPARRGSGTHFANGWPDFAQANKLKLGDGCVFELVSRGKKWVMNVQIIRKNSGRSS